MQSLIDRLGFTSWAQNEIYNFLEDHHGIISASEGSDGGISAERRCSEVTCYFDGDHITITARAHTKDGWKGHTEIFKRSDFAKWRRFTDEMTPKPDDDAV